MEFVSPTSKTLQSSWWRFFIINYCFVTRLSQWRNISYWQLNTNIQRWRKKERKRKTRRGSQRVSHTFWHPLSLWWPNRNQIDFTWEFASCGNEHFYFRHVGKRRLIKSPYSFNSTFLVVMTFLFPWEVKNVEETTWFLPGKTKRPVKLRLSRMTTQASSLTTISFAFCLHMNCLHLVIHFRYVTAPRLIIWKQLSLSNSLGRSLLP